MIALLLVLVASVLAQFNMGQFTGGSSASPFVPPSPGPAWWPAPQYVAASGKLLPNPGASLFAFQFNGPQYGANFITLPYSLSGVLPRTFSLEAWIWLPAAANRDQTQAVLPILSRFNPRLTSGPAILDSYNDFGLEILNSNGLLHFWMGGQQLAAPFGFNITSSSAVPTGAWTHVAVSVVSSESRNPYYALLFVNGVQVGAGNWQSGAIRVYQSTEAIALGYRQEGNATFFFEGLVDEVRFWSSALQSADVAANMHLYLQGSEPNLVALYRLDDALLGGTITDSGAGEHHGYTLKPLWTLGGAQTLHRAATGVAGVAVAVPLVAVDLASTPPSGFEYTLDALPTNGCLYAPSDTTMTCATATDLGVRVFAAGNIEYAANESYTGADQFAYKARRVGETSWSDGAFVDLNVITAPPSGCLTQFDQCGVCGGDGTSCTTGGCDGHGGKFDLCMVCGGDSSTCTCAVYKSYKLAEMDCILFDHEINRTLVRIENSIGLLSDTLGQLASYDPSGPFDLMQQIRHLCDVRNCLNNYVDELSVFNGYLNGFLPTAYLCPVTPAPTVFAGEQWNATAGVLPTGEAWLLGNGSALSNDTVINNVIYQYQ